MDDKSEKPDNGADAAEAGNPEEIAKKLDALNAKWDRNEALAKLMADPDIRRILEARQKGEKVAVQIGLEQPKPQPEPEPDDLDTMDNAELAKYILAKSLGDMPRLLDEKLGSLLGRLERLESHVQEGEVKSVRQQVDEARGKYPDFDNYRDAMLEINRQNPGLGPEELYLIAKKRAGGLANPGPVATERPTPGAVRAPKTEPRKEPLPTGKAGFDKLLGEALESLDLSDLQ